MKARIAINGAFAGRPVTGLERFALECVRALDACVEPGRFVLVVPLRADVSSLPTLKNIAVVRFGRFQGVTWEQVSFACYVRVHGLRALSLCNTAPILAPGVVCIHDVFYRSRATDFRGNIRGWLAVRWHRFQYAWCSRFAQRIVTVSRYSASEIMRWYGVPPERITIAGNGWEHITRIEVDDGIFARFPALAAGGYFLALGSRAPNKNFQWIARSAACNPKALFAIAGGRLKSAHADTEDSVDNMKFLGRVTDGEMKALLLRCRALVFPSEEEGFGIPPLEALSLGRPVLVADRPPMREIYGEAVHYIPTETIGSQDNGLENGMSGPVEPPGDVLARHTWDNVAHAVLSAADADGESVL